MDNPECYNLIGYTSCYRTEYFAISVQLSRCIGSAFHVTGMGFADWVESWLPKTALAVAVLSLLKPMDTTESEQQESVSKFYYPTKL